MADGTVPTGASNGREQGSIATWHISEKVQDRDIVSTKVNKKSYHALSNDHVADDLERS